MTDSMNPSDAIKTIRRIAELYRGYRSAMRHGETLHANDIGDDPEQLERAAESLDAEAQAFKEVECSLCGGDGWYHDHALAPSHRVTCTLCNGTGRLLARPVSQSAGRGPSSEDAK
jgi:hypothetical protein